MLKKYLLSAGQIYEDTDKALEISNADKNLDIFVNNKNEVVSIKLQQNFPKENVAPIF